MSAAQSIFGLLNTPENADLGPRKRPGTKSESELENALSSLLPGIEEENLILALLLLWHDHLDAAHSISQEFESADGSYVHAIMHRREPDYWNSKYWFRRVGNHPCFPEIANRIKSDFTDCAGPGLPKRLLPQGQWDPFAFVDACEEAARDPNPELQSLLRQLQRIEFEALLTHLLQS